MLSVAFYVATWGYRVDIHIGDEASHMTQAQSLFMSEVLADRIEREKINALVEYRLEQLEKKCATTSGN